MDTRAVAREVDPPYELLALCARAEGHPLFYEHLERRVAAFTRWDDLPAEAERHGMGALLWHHIQHAGLTIPRTAQQTLAGLYLRQRAVNRVHTQILQEIDRMLEGHGVRPLVLKGIALATQLYPDPALRAVSDIDLLVREAEMRPALQVLESAGFRAGTGADPDSQRPPEELIAYSPPQLGIQTRVELHHYGSGRPYWFGDPRQEELWGLDNSPQPLRIGEQIVQVPAPLDTLRYLSRHLKRHLIEATADRPLQLKWVADIVSLVERHARAWDWPALRKDEPALLQRLEVFYSLTPVPRHLVGIIPVTPGQPPRGVNQYPRGWPGHQYRGRRPLELLRLIGRTLAVPSEWWLRLYNGIGERGLTWYGVVIHPLQIAQLALRSQLRRARLEGFKPSK